MNTPDVQLVLGTAQFGMTYGIVGRGESVPADETKKIIDRAWELGIRRIDTAAAYGNIEERLIDLIDSSPFEIISKIPAIPYKLSKNAVEEFVSESIRRMRTSLGSRLQTILFHRGEDLLDDCGENAWRAALDAIKSTNISLGASCYTPTELADIQSRYSIKVAQLPGNAFDQRLKSAIEIDEVEIHLRSIFLQGILLRDPEEIAIRLPVAAAAINKWHRWCRDHDLTQLQAALSIAKNLPGVRYCVIGIDRLEQLEEIVEAWSHAYPMNISTLAINNLDIIDPRRWVN